MYLFAKPHIEELCKNGTMQEKGKDHIPVVKLFLRNTGCIWLITEIDPENLYLGFGLYDLADGSPKLGNIDLSTVTKMTNNDGLPVERDIYFTGKYPISMYETAAKHLGYITDVDSLVSPPSFKNNPGYNPT